MLHRIHLLVLSSLPFFCALPNVRASGPDLSVDVFASPDPAKVGEPLKYEVRVMNHGDAAATGITVTNLLQPTVVVQSVNSSLGTSTIGDGKVVITIDALSPLEEATVDIIVIPQKAEYLN